MQYRIIESATAGLVILLTCIGNSQERQPSATVKGAQSIQAAAFEEIDKDLSTIPELAAQPEAAQMQEVNPRKHYGREERIRGIPKPPAKRDPLLDFQVRASAAELTGGLELGPINIDGQGFSGVNPPDTTADVGKDHYIQALNIPGGTSYIIYKKSDASVEAGPFRLSDLGGTGVSGLGDPIVAYDHLAQRWLLSEFADHPVNALHVYISKTDDPIAGGWFHYRFDTPNFPDYPKYGVWSDGYYVTSNEPDGPAIYALDRAKMLAGDSAATMQRFVAPQLNGFGFQALTPADLDGNAPPNNLPFIAMRHRDDEVHNVGANDGSQDFLELYEVHIDWAAAANSILSGPLSIPVAEFDSDLNGLTAFNCFPQKGSTVRLDPLREVIMYRLQYRNFGTHNALVGSFVTDVNGNDHGGIRWFELRSADMVPWHIHQEGTYAPDSLDRWMSSIAMDGAGNIAIAYNATSTTTYPSVRFAGRFAHDPMGTMPRGEITLVDGTAANLSFRYGDYSSLTVDPADDKTFWFTGEYNPAAKWSTRIGTLKFQ